MAQVLLQCDVAIVRLTNLDLPPGAGSLFVRYYVAIGGGRRIRVDSRKLPCGAGEEPRWDERASLECRGGGADPLEEALGGGRSGAVQFELRCRRGATVWGRVAGSRLLGRGEAAWSDAAASPGTSVERWVRLAPSTTTTRTAKGAKSAKPVALLVRMGIRVRVPEASVSTQRIRRRGGKQLDHGECRCESCRWVGSEEDMFLSATVASMS